MKRIVQTIATKLKILHPTENRLQIYPKKSINCNIRIGCGSEIRTQPNEVHPIPYKITNRFRMFHSVSIIKRITRNIHDVVLLYFQSLTMVGQCTTVEQWWGMYSHLTRPDDLPNDTSFHLFKVGVRPMWEDGTNINGGKWVRLRSA